MTETPCDIQTHLSALPSYPLAQEALYSPSIYPIDFAPYAWPAGETREIAPPIGHDLEQLAGLGLTASDFAAFKVFVGHPFAYTTRLVGRADWMSAPDRRPLTNSQLISHLKGERWIGTGARKSALPENKAHNRTRFFVFDLDAGDDVFGRLDQIVDALAEPPGLVFRSSASGGLHAWYFLSAPVDLYRLCDSTRTGGAVVSLLAKRGIELRPGRVELYPTPTTRWSRGNRLRLPFGAQSLLLDPSDYSPLTGLPLKDLRHVTRAFDNGDIRTVEFDRLFQMAISSPSRLPVRRAKLRPHVRNPELDALFSTGLTGPNQGHDALVGVTFRCRSQGLDERDCAAAVWSWFEGHHNGFSRTYNRSPGRARRECEALVAGIYKKFGPQANRTTSQVTVGISEAEVRRITAAFPEPISMDRCSTGKSPAVLKRYRLHMFAFAALQRNKAFVLDEARADIAQAREKESGASPISVATQRAVPHHLRYGIGAADEFVVPFPHTLRAHLAGFSPSSYGPYWCATSRTNLYERVRTANPFAGRCASYRVRLDFDAMACGETSYLTLDAALAALYSFSQLVTMYTRHYARRIRASATAIEPATSGVEASDRCVAEWIVATRVERARAA